jgi:hypothetical protein
MAAAHAHLELDRGQHGVVLAAAGPRGKRLAGLHGFGESVEVRRAVLSCCLLAACSEPRPPTLADMESFAGDVEIHLKTPAGERTVSGELTFCRRTGNLQLTRRGDQTVVLASGRDIGLRVFVDAVPRAPNEAEEADHRLLTMAVFGLPGADAVVEARESGYQVRSLAQTWTVKLTPRAPSHGG